jgi:hypothetical protein
MSASLDTIKEAVAALPESERTALAAWLNLRDMDDWDQQMHRDFSTGGRAHSLAERMRAEVRAGKFGPMPGPDDAPDDSH